MVRDKACFYVTEWRKPMDLKPKDLLNAHRGTTDSDSETRSISQEKVGKQIDCGSAADQKARKFDSVDARDSECPSDKHFLKGGH